MMETIHYQSSQSDGYIYTTFYRDRNLAELDYNIDEGFSGTDSEGSFEVPEGHTIDITTLQDILDRADLGDERVRKLIEDYKESVE